MEREETEEDRLFGAPSREAPPTKEKTELSSCARNGGAEVALSSWAECESVCVCVRVFE